MTDYQIFEAGDVVLQSGLTYRGARLAYKTFGTLDAAKSNVIVHPTSYGAQHPDLEWRIGPGRALDNCVRHRGKVTLAEIKRRVIRMKKARWRRVAGCCPVRAG